MTRWWLLALILSLSPAARADDATPTAERVKAAEKEYAIPYRLTDTKHILVRVKVNGKGPFNLILDTGAPAVFITKKSAERAGLDTDKDGWAATDSFELEGGLKVSGAKARVADLFQLEGMNGMGLAGVELHGVIGYNVLAKFRITYDFAADKLAWVPLEFDPPPVKAIGKGGQGGLELLGPLMKVLASFMGIKPNFDAKPRGFLGFEVDERKDGVFVKAVLAESPAAKAGLKAGDKFTAIGIVQSGSKKKPSMLDIDRPRDLVKALAEAKVGDEAKIEILRDDKTETLLVPFGKGL